MRNAVNYRVHLAEAQHGEKFVDVLAKDYRQDKKFEWIYFYQQDGTVTDSFAQYMVTRIQRVDLKSQEVV